MPTVGLDPAHIKYVVVTHGHGDHSAGAKYLQDTYGARVMMSEVDGDTTITMYLTPGHTMGTVSLAIPVKDKGTPHTVAFWGGTAINANTPTDNLVAYSSSARRFENIAASAGADVLLSETMAGTSTWTSAPAQTARTRPARTRSF